MDCTETIAAFLNHQDLGWTDWHDIDEALRSQLAKDDFDPQQRTIIGEAVPVARAFAVLWTKNKDEPGFAQPTSELAATVEEILLWAAGSPDGEIDPFNYRAEAVA